MRYARSAHWNKVFQRLYQAGTDLDWGDQWTNTFVETFRSNSIKRVLDLGCGTGNDVVRLADAGFQVMGLDYSVEALKQASLKQSTPPSFVLADMAQPLPFATSSFDAVMSNVSVHMFSDSITRAIFSDIWRIVRPNGLFVFHLNAIEDRPLRMKWKPVIKEIEPNYVLEQDGQTMHFFSETYLRELLNIWSTTTLEPVEILHHDTQQPFKRVWRGIAQK